MVASTSPAPRDQSDLLGQSAAAIAPDQQATEDAFRDPYAESELRMRHERTERAIRKAQEQV